MKTAIYPGSFDPVTLGHIDIIRRAAKMTDRLIIGVLKNSSKTPLFSIEERVNMLIEACKDLSNVEVRHFDGLLVDFAKACNASVIIRGLRAVTDFEYELQIAQTNAMLSKNQLDTMFLVTSVKYSYLSSSGVKEIAAFGGDISKCCPGFVADMVYEKYGIKRD